MHPYYLPPPLPVVVSFYHFGGKLALNLFLDFFGKNLNVIIVAYNLISLPVHYRPRLTYPSKM